MGTVLSRDSLLWRCIIPYNPVPGLIRDTLDELRETQRDMRARERELEAKDTSLMRAAIAAAAEKRRYVATERAKELHYTRLRYTRLCEQRRNVETILSRLGLRGGVRSAALGWVCCQRLCLNGGFGGLRPPRGAGEWGGDGWGAG